MDFETLFLISCILNGLLLSWNCALLDSRDHYKKKWEKELKNEYKR